MRVGIKLPTSGPFAGPDSIRAIATTAEELGYDSVWVQDHVTRSPGDVQHHFGMGASDAWPETIVPDFYESLTTLAHVAAVTSAVQLGTSAIVLPLRDPVWTAKTLATIDRLSHGRVILGAVVGGAYVKEELAAIGSPDRARVRGRMTDEWLDVMARVWTDDVVEFEGRFITVQGAQVYPKPVKDTIPVWIGGTSEKALDRVARRGAGWLGIWLSPDEIAAGTAAIARQATECGRDPGGIAISTENWLAIDEDGDRARARSEHTRKGFSGYLNRLPNAADDHDVARLAGREAEYSLVGSPDEVIARVRKYQQAGASNLILRVIAGSLEEAQRSLALFADKVRPAI